ISLVRGRGFLRTDAAGSPRVAIVNEAFAAKYLGNDPVGKRIRLEGEDGYAEIVGITATSKYVYLVERPTDFLYLPLSQNPEPRLTMLVALVGLYGLVAYQVARRTREIGIRMALGAERQHVMRMVLKHAARMGVAGIVIGLILTCALRD